MDSSIKSNISYNSQDKEWDEFLFQTPGGHYAQSSLWAQVNESVGWEAIRITCLKEKKIVAGVQMLIRKKSSVTIIGYITKGPVFGTNETQLWEIIFSEISNLARKNQICFVAMQPPDNATWLNQLPKLGFQPSSIKMEPTATIILDLKKSTESLLNEMDAGTRYNIHLSSRKGISVREGSANDLHIFYDLLKSTSQRQQFQIYPKQFFIKMWEVFNPLGQIKIFLSIYKGNIISAQLALIFGNTVVNKMCVWSGQHANRKPNNAILWHSIQWAKNHGYHFYNLEGIEQDAAISILNNKPIPQNLSYSYTSFKVGFGGKVITLPGVYEYIYNHALEQFYNDVQKGKNLFGCD